MNHDLLKAFLLYEIDLEGVDPIIETTFTHVGRPNFTKAEADINTTIKLSEEEQKHFLMVLQFLETSEYQLYDCPCIHIINSSTKIAPCYFVKIMNTSLEQSDDGKGVIGQLKHELYFNYNPELFTKFVDNYAITSYPKWTIHILNNFPFSSANFIRRDNEPQYMPNKNIFNIKTISNAITTWNCLTCIILNEIYYDPNIIETIMNRPFPLILRFVCRGFICSWLGKIIANLWPYKSTVLFNVAMCASNYLFYRYKQLK